MEEDEKQMEIDREKLEDFGQVKKSNQTFHEYFRLESVFIFLVSGFPGPK